MSKKLEWGGIPKVPPPKNPYRDTLLVYGGMALVILIVAWLTGGSIAKAVLVAAVFFVIASGWTMYRFRVRAREAARRPEGDT